MSFVHLVLELRSLNTVQSIMMDRDSYAGLSWFCNIT